MIFVMRGVGGCGEGRSRGGGGGGLGEEVRGEGEEVSGI